MIRIYLPGVNMKVRDAQAHLEIALLIVTEEIRGEGLGSRAIRSVQQLGRPIRLTAVPGMGSKTRLHRFYRRLGFRAIGRDSTGHTEFEWLPGGAQ